MYTFQINTLIQFSNFLGLLHISILEDSSSERQLYS
jgi:hypothetical protein